MAVDQALLSTHVVIERERVLSGIDTLLRGLCLSQAKFRPREGRPIVCF